MGAESLVSMVMLGLNFSVLVAVYLRFTKTWCLLSHWHLTTRERQQRASWHAEENRELRSTLRAEKAHVEQLQRKLEILQALLPLV
jgi:hypothetical protein